jgi:methionyl aminopeptidase
VTVGVGTISAKARKLLDTTRDALMAGIAEVGPGRGISRIGRAVQTYAEKRGFSVVEAYVGHGIGKELHEEPQVPNFVMPGYEFVLQTGHCVAIEPMLNVGGKETRCLDDGWTVVTRDGSLSAHFEHTVAVTKDGHEILTLV